MAWTRTAYRRKPKFTIGEFLTDPNQVISAVQCGKWLYLGLGNHARAYAASWIGNMNFSCVMSYVRNKQLAFAHRNDEYPYVFVAKWCESEPWDGPEKRGEWWATCTEVPSARIVAFTKDAVASQAEKAVIEATGKRVARVQVRFELPEPRNIPVALLK